MVKINPYSKTFEKYYIDKLYDFLYSKLDNAYKNEKYKVEKAKTLYFSKEKDLLNVLLDIKNDLRDILASNVTLLKGYQTKYNLKQGRKYKKTKKIEEHKLYSIVYKIFVLEGYENKICKDDDKKIAYGIVKDLGLTTCPYCNRNFITSIKRDETKNNKVTRPQLDHFISKSNFPLLACSLYNLVPSCSTCNLLKSDDKNDDLISPYELDSENFKFKYKLTKDFKFGKDNTEGIELEITGDFKANKETFLLEELYNTHKYVISDILNKAYDHPREYANQLFEFKNGAKPLITMKDVINFLYSDYINENEIYSLLYGTKLSTDEFFKRPLSKLTYDVLFQKGLINKK